MDTIISNRKYYGQIMTLNNNKQIRSNEVVTLIPESNLYDDSLVLKFMKLQNVNNNP